MFICQVRHTQEFEYWLLITEYDSSKVAYGRNSGYFAKLTLGYIHVNLPRPILWISLIYFCHIVMICVTSFMMFAVIFVIDFFCSINIDWSYGRNLWS